MAEQSPLGTHRARSAGASGRRVLVRRPKRSLSFLCKDRNVRCPAVGPDLAAAGPAALGRQSFPDTCFLRGASSRPLALRNTGRTRGRRPRQHRQHRPQNCRTRGSEQSTRGPCRPGGARGRGHRGREHLGPGAARRGPHVRRGLRMRFDGEANSQPRPAREQLPEPRPARPLTDATLCPHSPGPPTWGSRPPRHLLPAHAMIATSSPG